MIVWKSPPLMSSIKIVFPTENKGLRVWTWTIDSSALSLKSRLSFFYTKSDCHMPGLQFCQARVWDWITGVDQLSSWSTILQTMIMSTPLPAVQTTNLDPPNALSAYNICFALEKNSDTTEDCMYSQILGYLILHKCPLIGCTSSGHQSCQFMFWRWEKVIRTGKMLWIMVYSSMWVIHSIRILLLTCV